MPGNTAHFLRHSKTSENKSNHGQILSIFGFRSSRLARHERISIGHVRFGLQIARLSGGGTITLHASTNHQSPTTNPMKRTNPSLQIIKPVVAATLAVVIMCGLSVRPAQAGYIVTLQQVGPDVVATGSGAIDTTGLAINIDPFFVGALVQPDAGAIITGPLFPAPNSQFFSVFVSGPASFGSGGSTNASSGSGDLVAFGVVQPLPSGQFNLFVPPGYVSGSPLSDSSTYAGATFASLGITPGTYEWTWGTGPNQNFTIQAGTAPTPTQLLNISTRLRVLTGNNVLIGGFIVTGASNKQVLLRALGPTLSQFGVTGVLADPTLELHNGAGALLASNDNWKDTQQAAIMATGKAPPNALESAILTSLAPGNYTAIVRGKNNTTGVALVEAYDLDQATSTTLTNISTRGFVDTGNNVMIGGFISGNGIKVIVRALGPTLTQFGVPNVLADPTLELRDVNGTLIASNDNWKDTQQAAIQASGFAPPNANESAIIVTRPAGNTTAIVRGKNNTTGNALVEVYILPP